ncbi:hypothetical protein L596_010236 [Steinernema carpocapsae]|uniref:Uncharacterized protein n=1 Tax=Steinernema carpocapsae TaxID=34508 RepID=A0A4U5PHY7_STECR|nr:hypothetical protein L596_010236 [Steinernema carpocapsae]
MGVSSRESGSVGDWLGRGSGRRGASCAPPPLKRHAVVVAAGFHYEMGGVKANRSQSEAAAVSRLANPEKRGGGEIDYDPRSRRHRPRQPPQCAAAVAFSRSVAPLGQPRWLLPRRRGPRRRCRQPQLFACVCCASSLCSVPASLFLAPYFARCFFVLLEE